MTDKLEVYIGADRSQAFAVRVLEHSIRRHASLGVEVFPMLDLPIPQPKDPGNAPRTGFSFSRFCIPKLAGYEGKALYLDADMLVCKDIRSLWEISFDGAKVVIQKEIKYEKETIAKEGAPRKRQKQCSVMLLDCGKLDWDIDRIIDDMNNEKYDYEMLMHELVILKEDEIKYAIPFEWNSLEYYDAETCLIHYTDMYTQPWVSCKNKNGYLWLNEVRLMLQRGILKTEEIDEEVRLGYLRPSLLKDLTYGAYVPRPLRPVFDRFNEWFDRSRNYVAHKEVYMTKKKRLQAMQLQTESRNR